MTIFYAANMIIHSLKLPVKDQSLSNIVADRWQLSVNRPRFRDTDNYVRTVYRKGKFNGSIQV